MYPLQIEVFLVVVLQELQVTKYLWKSRFEMVCMSTLEDR